MVATNRSSGPRCSGPEDGRTQGRRPYWVSEIDGPTGLDLRCQIREALVSYLQREPPEALPGRTGVARRHRRATPSRTTRIQFHAAHDPRDRVLRNPRTGPGDGPDPLAANGIDEPGLGWVSRRSQPTSPRSARPRFDLKYGMGGLAHDALMTNIELYGTHVVPRVVPRDVHAAPASLLLGPCRAPRCSSAPARSWYLRCWVQAQSTMLVSGSRVRRFRHSS
jgi:hypothetical protein